MLRAITSVTGCQAGMDDADYVIFRDGVWVKLTENELNQAKAVYAEISENERAAKIKAKAAEIILEKYPTYKQLNTIRAGGDELVAMSNYIDGIRAIATKAIADNLDVDLVVWDQVS
jgi:hypothetical protein